MQGRARALRTGGRRVAIVLFDDAPSAAADELHLPAEPAQAARQFYATLHDLDQGQYDLVLMEQPPSGSAWDAVRDRLARGATSPG